MTDLLSAMDDQSDTSEQTPKVEKIVDAKTRCPKCLSLKRDRYHRVKTREISGVTRDGRQYDRVTWRRTRCRTCGQARVDIEHSLADVPQ